MDYAKVLKATMTHIGQSVADLHPMAQVKDPPEDTEATASFPEP